MTDSILGSSLQLIESNIRDVADRRPGARCGGSLRRLSFPPPLSRYMIGSFYLEMSLEQLVAQVVGEEPGVAGNRVFVGESVLQLREACLGV